MYIDVILQCHHNCFHLVKEQYLKRLGLSGCLCTHRLTVSFTCHVYIETVFLKSVDTAVHYPISLYHQTDNKLLWLN